MGQHRAILLAIDTCGATGSVALGRLESGAPLTRILATAQLQGKTYSSLLIPRIGDVLREAQATLAQVAAIVIVNGPGSFTGVRVGVSTAKGLAEGAGTPLIAVSRLELLARRAGGSACVAIDAGRGEFYFGMYRESKRELEALYTKDEIFQAVRDSGLPLAVCEESIAASLAELNPLFVLEPTAGDALVAGAARFAVGAFEDAATLDGNYLRRPDAEKTLLGASASSAL